MSHQQPPKVARPSESTYYLPMLSVVGSGLRRTFSPLRPLPHSPLVRIVGLILIKRSYSP